MARASITFEDAPEGVMMALNFDTDLPSEAQMQAMIAFTAWAQAALAEEGDENVEVVFNDGESEEASREV